MVRLARDAAAKPVQSKGGHPTIFASELEAQRAVTIHLLAYFNGDYQRCGERIGAAKALANTYFKEAVNG